LGILGKGEGYWGGSLCTPPKGERVPDTEKTSEEEMSHHEKISSSPAKGSSRGEKRNISAKSRYNIDLM